MADQDTPTRSSNIEKAEGDRNTVADTDTGRRSEWGEGTSQGGGITNRPLGGEKDAREQEQPVERRPFANDPTRVENTRVSDSTTISNSGLGGGRPQGGATVTPERARAEGKEGPDDAVMPADDATLKTKI